MRQLPQQQARQNNANRRDRMWIMPFGAGAATHAGGSRALAWGQRIQDDRRGQRGKNGSARLPGTHKLRCIVWRDGGTRASCDLQSDQTLILVSTPDNLVRRSSGVWPS